MEIASETLTEFGVEHESKIISAHRTPDLLFKFAKTAEARGIEVIISGAGGAAHLPGMCASQTVLPVLGVPVESLSGRRKNFDDDQRIRDCRLSLSLKNRFVTENHEVGIEMRAGCRIVNAHARTARLAGVCHQVSADQTCQIFVADFVMPENI